MQIVIKRAYDSPAAADGYRVLIDRLWPRGVRKEQLALDEWCKDIAPTTELREWFAHDPAKFIEFKQRYLAQLKSLDVPNQLLARAKAQNLTLVYAAKNPTVNHAVVLREYMQQL